MNNNLFTIGEISKIKNITEKALRFYDKIGLIKPYHVDPMTKYRYYHANQMVQFDIIKAARILEISPNDLIPFFKNKDTQGLISLLKYHREKTLAKILKLQDIVLGIEHIQNTLTDAAYKVSCKSVYYKEYPERHIITMPYQEREDPTEILQDFSKLDILVNQLEGIATYESGVLFTLTDNTSIPNFIFTSVAKPLKSDHYHCIPKGTYLCTNFTTINAISRQNKLNKYIADNTLKPLDIIQVELLTDLFQEKQAVWELQVRI